MSEPQAQWPHELDEPARRIPGDRNAYMADMLGSLKQIQANTRRTTFAVSVGFVFLFAMMILGFIIANS